MGSGAEAIADDPACRNCSAPLSGAYCAACGQETNTHRRSVRGLLHELAEEIANFDSRMLRTARALLFEPGELPLAFREGRTRPYVGAVRLYLFVSVVFFVLLNMTGIGIVQLEVTATPEKVFRDASGQAYLPNPAYEATNRDPVIPKYLKVPNSRVDKNNITYGYGTVPHFFARLGGFHARLTAEERKRLLERETYTDKPPTKAEAQWLEKYVFSGLNRLAADPAALNGPLTTWLPRALFLLLPAYALLLALLYVRHRAHFFLVDHVVFSLSIHSFVFVVLIAAVGLAQIAEGGTVTWAAFATISLYIFLAMKRFYAQSWFWTTVKFFTVSGIYTVVFLLPALGGVFALSFFGGSLG